MFVYWGGHDSGKEHMKQYAMINNKTQLLWMIRRNSITKNIIKLYNTVHINGFLWRDETIRKIIYHNINGFRKCEKTEDLIYKYEPFKHPKGSITPTDRSTYYKLKRKRNYTNDDIEKYSQIEYINTNLYYDIIKNFIDKIGEEIPREMFVYDEIFKDVDLVSLRPPPHVVEDNVQLFQSSINIVPYKSNVLDSIFSKLDNFLHTYSQSDIDLLEAYNTDKNIVWNYLDEYKRQEDYVIRLLKKHDIPYIMFDLDTDSYKDTFGWETELPRDYTHRKDSWKNNERYDMILDIAKEYIHLHSF